MKTYKEFVAEGWFSGAKKAAPMFDGPRFPKSGEANQWMSKKVEHFKKHNPGEAHNLFSPSSADYMPRDVHVGSSWKPEHEAHYNALKAAHPDLVSRAKAATIKYAHHGLSRVGPNADFHGIGV